MALNALGRIEVIFQFKDQSGPGIRKAQGNVKKLANTVKAEGAAMNQAFMGAFPAIMAVGLIKQIAVGIGALLTPAIELQTSLRELQAFTGLSDDAFKKFNATNMETIKGLSLLVAKPVPELISGLTELRKKGFGARDAMSALIPVTMAAAVGHITVAESAEAASVMFHTFGLRGEALTFRMNQLAFAAANSAIGFSELPDLMSRIGQGVATVNPTFEELIFNLAMMRNIAPGAATSATQVRRALVKLGEKRKTIGEILGVDTLTSGGQLRALSEMMFEVADRGDNLDVIMTKLGQTFGSKAAAPLSALKLKLQQLMEQGLKGDELRDEFFKLRDGLVSGGDAIGKIFRQMARDNPTIMLDRLGIAFQQLAAAGGGALLNTVLDLADSLTGLVVWFTSATDTVNVWLTSINEAAPILGVLVGFVLKMVGTFGIMIGVFTLGRAATMLFGTAVQFAIAPLRNTAATMSSVAISSVQLTQAVAAATGSVDFFGAAWARTTALMGKYVIGARAAAFVSTTAAGGVSMLGRAVTFLTSSLGVVGLAVGVITMLMAAFGGFASDLSSLNRASLQAGGSVVEGVRDAAADFSGKVLQSAKRFEDMFKEAPTTLDAKTIGGLDKTLEKFLGHLSDPAQAEKLRGNLGVDVASVQLGFAELRDAAKHGEEFSTEKANNLAGFMDSLSLRFQEMANATGDKSLGDVAKTLAGNAKGLRTFNENTENRVKALDATSNTPQFAVASKVDAAKRDVEVTTDAENARASKGRLERAIQAQAEVKARHAFAGLGPVISSLTGTDGVGEAKSDILDANDGKLRTQLASLNTVMTRVADRLDQPLDVNVTNEADPERSLVPGALG